MPDTGTPEGQELPVSEVNDKIPAVKTQAIYFHTMSNKRFLQAGFAFLCEWIMFLCIHAL